MPFGIDWHVYPSIDRKLVTGPLIVENTHNSWCDRGIQGHFGTKRYTAVFYATNGFDYEYMNGSGDSGNFKTTTAFGGHFSIVPKDFFEIGFSYAQLFNRKEKKDMPLMGIDFQTEYKSFSAKGEYIVHTIRVPGESISHSGYYFQGMYDFNTFYFVVRHGMFFSGNSADNDMARLT